MGNYSRFLGARNMNVGSALNHIVAPGEWVNVDSNPNCQPDLVADYTAFDFSQRVRHHFGGDFDSIWASHTLEHVSPREFFLAYDQFWKILKPGGCVLAFVPHGGCDIAWEDPLHTMRFSSATFSYLCTQIYEVPGNAGYGADQGLPTHRWEIEVIAQVPTDEWKGASDEELEQALKRYRNVISEVHCVMRKAR